MAKAKPAAAFNLEKVPQKADTPVQDTSSETKKMTGFSNIKDVAAAAPAKPSGGDVATPVRTGGRAAATRGKTEEEKQKEAKDAAVEEALSKVGAEMMRELACLPYEAWAYFFSDPQLKLTEQEAKTLANSYFLIAKALKPEEMASWKVLLALAMLQNTRIVLLKLREHGDRVKKQKALSGGDGEQPQVSLM